MSTRRYRQNSKTKKHGFSKSVIEHPTGEQWDEDQSLSASRRPRMENEKRDRKPLIDGVDAAMTWLPDLPTQGLQSNSGDAIIVESYTPYGATTPVPVFTATDRRSIKGLKKEPMVVSGFPEHLNQICESAEERELLRRERLKYANRYCLKVRGQAGKKGDELYQYREMKGALDQCYGLLGVDASLALRFGQKRNLPAAPWLKIAVEYGAKLLTRTYKVQVLAAYFHPGNPFLGNDFGFGSHVQFQVTRAIGGQWLSETTGFARAGPAICSQFHLRRLGIDVHERARVRYAADRFWLYEDASEVDFKRFRLKPATIMRIREVRQKVEEKKWTVAAQVEKDLIVWDQSWGRKTQSEDGTIQKGAANLVERLGRNLDSVQKNQSAVDWVLSQGITFLLLDELRKHEKWKGIVEQAQRCAKEIHEECIRRKFSVSLTQLLLEWESNEAVAELNREHENIRLLEEKMKESVPRDELDSLTRRIDDANRSSAEFEKSKNALEEKFGKDTIRSANKISELEASLAVEIKKREQAESDYTRKNALLAEMENRFSVFIKKNTAESIVAVNLLGERRRERLTDLISLIEAGGVPPPEVMWLSVSPETQKWTYFGTETYLRLGLKDTADDRRIVDDLLARLERCPPSVTELERTVSWLENWQRNYKLDGFEANSSLIARDNKCNGGYALTDQFWQRISCLPNSDEYRGLRARAAQCRRISELTDFEVVCISIEDEMVGYSYEEIHKWGKSGQPLYAFLSIAAKLAIYWVDHTKEPEAIDRAIDAKVFLRTAEKFDRYVHEKAVEKLAAEASEVEKSKVNPAQPNQNKEPDTTDSEEEPSKGIDLS